MIEIIKLSKSYDKKTIFKDLDVTFAENNSNIIMGKSGCGKTTLLRILTGLEKADNGEIRNIKNKKFSQVFQEDRLLPGISALKNVQIACDKNISKEFIRKQLSEVGLKNTDITKPVFELSGGMARRVAIVRAIVTAFDIIILDEPFKGLDNETKSSVMTYVKNRISKKTMIMVTHDYAETEFFGGNLLKIF